MATRFDKLKEDVNSINGGYEGDLSSSTYTIPSCGISDVDRAVFNLFDKDLPLTYRLNDEIKKVPVIFATGERFAILRRKKPITDKRGALILPLISITRSSVENKPQKGVSNNEMFPHIVTRRVADENTAYRQLNNFEGLNNLKNQTKEKIGEATLKNDFKNNIYETIEIPPVKYVGVTYEITIWSSFTQQMNDFIETIMSAYTINPGQQFKLESEKGYWFPAFVETSLSMDTSYADFTDAERYVKYMFNLSATGYIISPDIDGVKKGIKSIISAPEISFESFTYPEVGFEKTAPVGSSDPNARLLTELETDDDIIPSQVMGVTPDQILSNEESGNTSSVYSTKSRFKQVERTGEWSSDYNRRKKIFIRDKSGNNIPVLAKTNSSGETIYDQSYAESIFDITNKE